MGWPWLRLPGGQEVKRLSFALMAGVLLVGTALTVGPSALAAGHGDPGGRGGHDSTFSPAELKVIQFIAGRMLAEGDQGRILPADLERATGVPVDEFRQMDAARLQAGVVTELRRLAGGGVESPSGAGEEGFPGCSSQRGPEASKRAGDGRPSADWLAPDFTLPTTTGGEISLSDYRGRDVALVFLSGTCSGSLQIVHNISRIRESLGLEEMAILPVYVNSGSVEDVNTWTQYLRIDLPLMVSESCELWDAYGFQRVPTIFLIDETGHVRRWLVGERDREGLRRAFREFSRIDLRKAS
jgi:peroxiredoxin